MKIFQILTIISLIIILSLSKSFAKEYLKDDQQYTPITLYNSRGITLNFNSILDSRYLRDMQDYYTAHMYLRRDNYQLLGKLQFSTIYNMNKNSSVTGFVSTELNYNGMRQIDSALNIDKTYITYYNPVLGEFSFGSVDGLYEEVALWSNTSGPFGGVANIPTFISISLLGIDNALNTFQYRKSLYNDFTFGIEYTVPDVSYRTGGASSAESGSSKYNFRAGMERKEGGAISFIYDNGKFGIGAVYHYARVAHSHNANNPEADELTAIKYRTYNHDIVIGSKVQQGPLYYSAGISFEDVIGRWRGTSSIGPLVSRHKRLGFSVGANYDLRENNKGFMPAIEYDFSQSVEKSGLSSDQTSITGISFNTENYAFPKIDIGNDLSDKRVDPDNTNKIIFSLAYYCNQASKFYVSYAYDLRSPNQIHNSTGDSHSKEYQFTLGYQISF